MPKASMAVLSINDIERVHEASLRILSEVGVKIDSRSVLKMLSESGLRTDDEKQLVFFSESRIEDALKSAPKTISICSRGGKDFTIPHEGVQLVSPDGQPPAVFDINTGKKRPSTFKDLLDFITLADALPEVDFIWPPVVATDMPPSRSSYYEFLATIANSSKHIQHAAATAEEANFQIDVGTAILGDKEELRKRPIFSNVCTPISPLRYDEGEVEGMVVLAKAGIPIVQLSMGIAGAVTPVSIAGTMAVVNAENLAGLAITQTANPGAPSIYSSFSGVSDLRSGVFLCGTPESVLMDAAATEMARHYSLPSCAGGPGTAARSISAECGYQSAMSAMAALLIGSDMMVGLGGFDRSGVVSLDKLVMDCEVWRWLRRLRQGIAVDDATLGLEAVKRQGPGGTYLSDPHTLKHMRTDLMIPQVTSYHKPGESNHVADDMLEYCKRKVKDLLATHRPSMLSRAVAARVEQVAKKYGILHKNGTQIFGHE